MSRRRGCHWARFCEVQQGAGVIQEEKERALQPRGGTVFMWLVAAPVVVGAVLVVLERPDLFLHPHPGGFPTLLFWTGVLAVVGLLPVSVSKRLELTLTFPMLL